MGLPESIRSLDQYFAKTRPLRHGTMGIDDKEGRIIYGTTPADLYRHVGPPEEEHIASIRELMGLRVRAVGELLRRSPAFEQAVDTIEQEQKLPQDFYRILGETRREADQCFSHSYLWKVRLTTSTHMVRADDEEGKDTVFFHTEDPFDPFTGTQKFLGALEGELSDGGIAYDNDTIASIRRHTSSDSRLTYKQYLDARGGNFTGEEFMNHPVFATSCGQRVLMERYTYALQIMSLLEFYHQGLHSGWRPGEMRKNFGRPIALGKIGEAFYPPNNSTVGHAALVLNRRLPADMEI